ncbi:MAG: hypothetical protein JXL80_01810 [Planctomycetes bacterium]|nr:hypothetical protein [Planctomycetota bacterium]
MTERKEGRTHWTLRLTVAMFVVLGCWLAAGSPIAAFTVDKNVNSGEPPAEKLVIFDHKAGHEHIVLKDPAGGCTMSFADDGTIDVPITGNAEIKPTVYWKPKGDLGETVDLTSCSYLLVRMKLEGDIKRTFDNGKTSSSRPDNLWFGLRLYDKDGQPAGNVNIASVTDDEKTPAEMVTVKVPAVLLVNTAHGDAKQVAGVGFYWPKTHDYNDRQCRLVVERISLAD